MSESVSILILYPSAFNCLPKFSRKVLTLVGNLDQFQVVFPEDANQHIYRTFAGSPKAVLIEDRNWNILDLNHAIVFDDGEEFQSEVDALRKAGVDTRLIRIAITRVVNIRKGSGDPRTKRIPNYEYIGRGSYWGNPYSMHAEGETREEVIRKYAYDFNFDKFPNKDKEEIYRLAGKRLGCFCKPKVCHGDILADFLNRWDDGK